MVTETQSARPIRTSNQDNPSLKLLWLLDNRVWTYSKTVQFRVCLMIMLNTSDMFFDNLQQQRTTFCLKNCDCLHYNTQKCAFYNFFIPNMLP